MEVQQSYSLIHSNLYFLATGKNKNKKTISERDKIVLLRFQKRPFS